MANKRTVDFTCQAPEAGSVFVAGTFNQWRYHEIALSPSSSGDWLVRLELEPGRYEFKFIIDGEWICEPGCHASRECPKCVPDGAGGMNRFLDVE